MKLEMRVIELNDFGMERIAEIRSHIIKQGFSKRCPSWIISSYTNDMSCSTCWKLFPKANVDRCPCSVYSPSYLIKRLTEIIAYKKRLRKLERR